MQHIDYGLGILTPAVFADWPADLPFDLAAVYGRLVQRRRLAGFETQQRFYEIGSPQGLSETDGYLRQLAKDTR